MQKEPAKQQALTKQKEWTKQMNLSDIGKASWIMQTKSVMQKESAMHQELIKQKVLTRQKVLTKQQGFTLIELALVLVVMAIIAGFTTKAYLFQQAFAREQARADKTIEEIAQISQAMGAWRLDKGDWADVANDCADAMTILTNPPPTLTNAKPTAYLRYIDALSPYSTHYVTSCDANNFTIEVKSNKDYAPYIRTHLAATMIKPAPNDDTTITSTPRETINPTLADFLPFEGTTFKGVKRQMLGDIDMGGNAMSNLSEIEASEIELNGQDIKLGIGKFVSMGSDAFSSLSAIVNKPNCKQGAMSGRAKIILRLHGVTTKLGSTTGIRNVSWSAKFIHKNTTQWQLTTTGLKAITGVAETFCDYGRWNR